MKFEIKIIDDIGNVRHYTINPNSSSEKKNLDNFILDALQVSEDKRKLPFMMQCPNGLEVYPSIKMKFNNFGSPLLGDSLESMQISWR